MDHIKSIPKERSPLQHTQIKSHRPDGKRKSRVLSHRWWWEGEPQQEDNLSQFCRGLILILCSVCDKYCQNFFSGACIVYQSLSKFVYIWGTTYPPRLSIFTPIHLVIKQVWWACKVPTILRTIETPRLGKETSFFRPFFIARKCDAFQFVFSHSFFLVFLGGISRP